jgi:hypothetical protein
MRQIIVLLLAVFTVTTASAQNDSEYTFLTPFDAICTTEQIFAETLYNYGEVPIMRGQSLRNINGAMVAMNTVLFMNTKTGSWTLAEQMAPDALCVLAMGQNWEVYQPQENPASQT